jgi:hypothetical protein
LPVIRRHKIDESSAFCFTKELLFQRNVHGSQAA